MNGKDYKSLKEGNIPVFGTGGYMLSVNKALSYDKDAIGIGRKGTIDKPFILKAPFWTVDTLFYAIPKEEVNLNFLNNIFQKTNWKKYDESTGVPSLTKKTINKVLVYIPNQNEQTSIGKIISLLDSQRVLQQLKIDQLNKLKKALLQQLFPEQGSKIPRIRFYQFTDPWEQRKFGELYKKVSNKNDGSFGEDKIISVANMYFKSDAKISDQKYLKTYNVFNVGDIAFEGNKSKNFSHGRFVENTIGDGIVSHVFDVFKPTTKKYDLEFWKYLINNENVMGPILIKSTNSSTMMTNLVSKDFLKQNITVPSSFLEQSKIGVFLRNIDSLITLHQRKLDQLKQVKKFLLQNMFI